MLVSHLDSARAGRWLVWLGAIGMVTVLAGSISAAYLLSGFTGDVADSLEITGDALSGVGTSVELAAEVLDTASGGVSLAAESLLGVADSTGNIASVSDGLARITASEIPETLESVRTALRPMIATARALDRTLQALSVFGINYNPDTPLSLALQNIDDELAPLAEEIRAQSESLAQVAPNMEQLGSNVTALAGDLDSIESRLGEAETLLSDYRALTDRAQATIAETTDALRVRSVLGYLTIGLLALTGITLSGAVFVLGQHLTPSPQVELITTGVEVD